MRARLLLNMQSVAATAMLHMLCSWLWSGSSWTRQQGGRVLCTKRSHATIMF